MEGVDPTVVSVCGGERLTPLDILYADEIDVKACFYDNIYDRIDTTLLAYVKLGERASGGGTEKDGKLSHVISSNTPEGTAAVNACSLTVVSACVEERLTPLDCFEADEIAVKARFARFKWNL